MVIKFLSVKVFSLQLLTVASSQSVLLIHYNKFYKLMQEEKEIRNKTESINRKAGESIIEGGPETPTLQTVEQAVQRCLTGDDLTSFLIRSACSNPSITYYLYWYLKVEVTKKFFNFEYFLRA